MKYLKDVLENKSSMIEAYSDQELESHLLNEAEEVEADNVSVALAHLSDIMGMADDLYNTFASLEDLDEGLVKTLEKAYITLDDLYAKVDSEYNIVSYDLDDMEIGDEVKEELALLDEAAEDDFSASSLSTLRMIGFRKVDPSNKAYVELNKKKKGKLLSLYGIPMRAGHYADAFAGIISVGNTKQYFLYYEDEGQIFDTFSNETTLIKDLKTLVGSNDIAESFRPGYDMVPAPISKDTYRAKGLRKLWGTKTSNDKWADYYVAMYDDGTIGIVNKQGVNRYSSVDAFKKGFEKFRKTGDLDESVAEDSLTEKLKSSDDASVWIRDFIDSTNPKFDGKSKKERIKMALGAYYAAQQ